MPMFSENRLRMELHTFNGQLLMSNTHNFIEGTVFIFSPRSHLKTDRQAALLNNQRVVTCGNKVGAEAFKNAGVMMADPRGLAMHHLFGAHNFTAEGLSNTLMT